MTSFELHLLRHGATTAPGRLIGRTDCDPAIGGIADCVAQATDLRVAHLIASDLRRARRAGEAIAAVRGIALRIDPRWRELDFGAWDGLAPADIDADALGRFWDDPDASPPPGGECWSSLVTRVSGAIAALAPVPTLIVTHGGAMRAALHSLCGFDRRQLWAFDLSHAALVSLRVRAGDRPGAQIVGLHPCGG